MREVQAMVSEEIHLGRRGENLATCVTFDVSEWQGAGEGTVHLLHQRNGDEYPYPCAITVENGVATWIITAADVEFAGRGKAELQYLDGEVCIKSAVFVTKTLRALGKAGEEPPEPVENWVNQVLEAGGSALESSEYAQQSAREAEESAAAARASEASVGAAAASAAGSASAAKTSETNAKASEAAALSAQRAAEKARDEAQGVAGGDFASTAYVDNKAGEAESNANAYTDRKIAAIPTPDVSGQIGSHNTDPAAHADIRAVAAEAKNLAAGKADANHTHTAADVGAVSKAGDTMTGTLKISNSGFSKQLEIHRTGTSGSVTVKFSNDAEVVGALGISKTKAPLFFAGEEETSNIILHTGNMESLGCTKIAVGSYSGSDSTSKSLTFDFMPKIVFIERASGNQYGIAAIQGMSKAWVTRGSTAASASSTLTWSDNKLTVKGSSSDQALNATGTYHYVAFG